MLENQKQVFQKKQQSIEQKLHAVKNVNIALEVKKKKEGLHFFLKKNSKALFNLDSMNI